MATHTFGTSTTTVLVAVQYSQSPAVLLPADLQTINVNILDDLNVSHPQAQISGTGGFVREGQLYVPNRGVLTLREGDWVAYDPGSGFCYLIPPTAVTGGDWLVDD